MCASFELAIQAGPALRLSGDADWLPRFSNRETKMLITRLTPTIAQATCVLLSAIAARSTMIQIDEVSPVTANTDITSNSDDGSPPFQSVNGRMLALASSPDGQRLFAGSFSNVWSSVDDGQTWEQVTWPQPQSGQFDVPGALGGWCVVDIAVSPVDPQTILVITRNDRASSDHGIWRSADGGGTWTSVHQFLVPGSTSPPAAGQLAWVAGRGRLVF